MPQVVQVWGDDPLVRQGRTLRKVRVRAGLTLRELAGRIGLSHTSLLQYEHGRAQPSGRTLLALAQEVGVSPEALGRPVHERLRTPEWPRGVVLGPRQASRLAVRITDAVDRAEGVEALGTIRLQPMHLEAGLAGPIRSGEEAEQRADRLRVLWGQGMHPWRDLGSEMVRRGWVLLHVPLPLAAPLARKPVLVGSRLVAVLATEPDASRDQLALAEILGWHLVGAEEQDPRWVRRFARALLVPRLAAEAMPGRGRQRMDLRELLLLKTLHGLSMSAWLDRLGELELLSMESCSDLAAEMHDRGWMEDEPIREGAWPDPAEAAVLYALNEGRIAPSQAAALLGESQLAFLARARGEAPRGRPRLH
ncbi:MAG: helix-turn-helix transcriptional regulator [Candidatus Sericytochromatia bacterium]|nr:helix-turn-helix transcriptional regulator [Candidatus Sericytochromatia bacterium]